MVRIEMQLPPEEAEIVWGAMTSAMDAGAESKGEKRGASSMDGATAEKDERSDRAEGAAHAEQHAQDDSELKAVDVTAVTSAGVAAPGGASTTGRSARADTAESEPEVASAAPQDHEANGSERTTEPADRLADVTAVTSKGDGVSERGRVEGERGHTDGCCAGAPMLPANDGQQHEEARADAMVNVARGYLRMHPQTLGSGYELVVITTEARLEKGQDGVGAVMRDGTPLPLEMARMLACDSARVNVTADETGALLDVGRRTRTIPPAIARALWLRDGCCRVPGCGRRRHLHAHHIWHWADGGPTCLANLVLVCSRHHQSLHEGRLFVEVENGKLVFRDAQGRERPAAPPSAATGQDLEELERFLRDADLHIDPSLNEPRWDGTRLDVAEALASLSVAEQTRAASTGRTGHVTEGPAAPAAVRDLRSA